MKMEQLPILKTKTANIFQMTVAIGKLLSHQQKSSGFFFILTFFLFKFKFKFPVSTL